MTTSRPALTCRRRRWRDRGARSRRSAGCRSPASRPGRRRSARSAVRARPAGSGSGSSTVAVAAAAASTIADRDQPVAAERLQVHAELARRGGARARWPAPARLGGGSRVGARSLGGVTPRARARLANTRAIGSVSRTSAPARAACRRYPLSGASTSMIALLVSTSAIVSPALDLRAVAGVPLQQRRPVSLLTSVVGRDRLHATSSPHGLLDPALADQSIAPRASWRWGSPPRRWRRSRRAAQLAEEPCEMRAAISAPHAQPSAPSSITSSLRGRAHGRVDRLPVERGDLARHDAARRRSPPRRPGVRARAGRSPPGSRRPPRSTSQSSRSTGRIDTVGRPSSETCSTAMSSSIMPPLAA